MRPVRTRFAPSPTGDLHVGNLRVAVFNYLYARHRKGSFILRVEDTDTDRNVEGSLERLMEDLRWAGIDWDEGPDVGGPHTPYLQSQRGPGYVRRAFQLKEAGLAYPCFCPGAARGEQQREARDSPGCSGACRELDPSETMKGERDGDFVLRFAVREAKIVVEDYVRGVIEFSGNDIGDFIILRSDGRATYNFAVVADDVDMEITHVIRGAGHLSNTPKQALLFDALGSERPIFAHLPTVLARDGTKLSKRSGAPGVSQLRSEGFHPDAVVNYLSLLGWSTGDDREIMTRDELVAELSLDGIGTSNAIFDPEKLRWMSQQHIAKMSTQELVAAVSSHLRGPIPAESGFDLHFGVEAIRTRLHTFGEINRAFEFLMPPAEVLAAARSELTSLPDDLRPLLDAVRRRLETVSPWAAEAVDAAIRDAGKELEIRGRNLFHPLRLSLCGVESGPDLGKVTVAIGREQAIQRLTLAISAIDAGA